MTTTEQIATLESRQLELLKTMRQSDAHASKCTKLGKSFADEYPEEHAAYAAANDEYNNNETALYALYNERYTEMEVEIEAREEEN